MPILFIHFSCTIYALSMEYLWIWSDEVMMWWCENEKIDNKWFLDKKRTENSVRYFLVSSCFFVDIVFGVNVDDEGRQY